MTFTTTNWIQNTQQKRKKKKETVLKLNFDLPNEHV